MVKFYLMYSNDDGSFVAKDFDDVGKLQDELIALLASKNAVTHLSCFYGVPVRITKPPYRYLIDPTTGDKRALFALAPEVGELDNIVVKLTGEETLQDSSYKLLTQVKEKEVDDSDKEEQAG